MEVNQVYQGDCMLLLDELEANSVDCVITDPPYSTPVITGFGRKQFKNVADLSIQEQYIRTFKEKLERVLKPNAPVFIFCNDSYFPSIFRAFYDWKCLQMVIWDKGKIGMGKPFRKQHEIILYANRESFEYYRDGITFSTVMKYKQVQTQDRLHPAEKPLDLIKDLLKGFTKDGDLVLDTFMGSGVVALGCQQLKRNWVGFELNPDFVSLINKRIGSNLSGFIRTSPDGDFSNEKEHNISLKESSDEDSQISSNDETSLNNNIQMLHQNLNF